MNLWEQFLYSQTSPEYREYKEKGGTLSYVEYKRIKESTGLSDHAKEILLRPPAGISERAEAIVPEEFRAGAPETEGMSPAEIAAILQSLEPTPPAPQGDWLTVLNQQRADYGLSPFTAEQAMEEFFAPEELAGYAQPAGEAPTDPYGRTATWDTDNAEWHYPPDWGEDPVTQQAGYLSPYQQQELALAQQKAEWQRAQDEWQRQEAARQAELQRERDLWMQEQEKARLEAERQARLAQLRANPASWLEYASFAGETPVIQPWMLPLMPKGYAIGQELPGWTPEDSLSGLLELTMPSSQYMSRLTPSAREQYYGYQKARTGAMPEDIQWRFWSQAPPSGQPFLKRWKY